MSNSIRNDYYLRKLLKSFTRDIINNYNEHAIKTNISRVYYQADISESDNLPYKIGRFPIAIVKESIICENKYNFLIDFVFKNEQSRYSTCFLRLLEYHISTKKFSGNHYFNACTLVTQILVNYAEYIIDMAVERNLDDQFINNQVRALVNDLSYELDQNESPEMFWSIKIYVSHLLMEHECRINHKFYKKLILRKPSITDFQHEKLEINLYDELELIRETTAVLEAEFKCCHNDLKGEIIKLIDILRLYKLGAVHTLKIVCKTCDSILQRDFVMTESHNAHIYCKYSVSPNELKQIGPFISGIKPLINDVYEKPTPNIQYLSIAMKWYKEALINEKSYEGCISSSYVSLEALFLRGGIEAKYRLALGVTVLFKVLETEYNINTKDNNIYEIIDVAHQVRSSYFHGEKNKKDIKPEQVEKACRQLLEINRLSLLTFFQIHLNNNTITKDIITTKLDKLVKDYDITKRKELTELIGGNPFFC